MSSARAALARTDAMMWTPYADALGSDAAAVSGGVELFTTDPDGNLAVVDPDAR